ncbi:MAG: hypothetical protein COB62_04440 [Piscirickettsiaceae bacterium]|nr:MAG: hypothetical protein COB62_04440 [Piscirickettsiaceae bacterium]
MKKITPICIAKKQSGLTLVELMVAMVIGLLLMAGVLQVFTANQQTYRVTENLSRVQENGRFAVDIINRFVRKAGFKGNTETSPAFKFLTGTHLTYVFSADQVIAGTNTDVYIRYSGGEGTGVTDCIGNPVAAGTEVTNRFYLDTTNKELECLSTTNPIPQPLVDNIEDMQILYGMALSNGTGHDLRADCYLPADTIVTAAVTNCTSGLNFNQVVSVRINLLLRTPEDNLTSTNAFQSYFFNDSLTPTTATDKRIYREFSTTIALRNVIL